MFCGLVVLMIVLVAPVAKGQLASSTLPGSVRDQIRNNVQERIQNLKNNQDVRNSLLEVRQKIASTTRNMVGDIRTEAKNDIKNASTSADRRGIRVEMRRDIFNAELNRVVGQLKISLNNLKQIRTRIETRIEKTTQDGRDMTNAKALLVTADAKLLAAEQAITSLSSQATSTLPTPATASSTVNLSKPRQLGADAIKAVNDARDSLNKVVLAIAHAMGQKLGNASSTPEANPTTNAGSSVNQ